MSAAPLRFHFKGSRDYVQGAVLLDALDGLMAGLFGPGAGRNLRFAVHKPITRQAAVHFQRVGSQGGHTSSVASLHFDVAGQRWLAAVDDTRELVEERQPEDREPSAWTLDLARRSVVVAPAVRSGVGTWVGANKALHERLFPEHTRGWWFVKAELERYPEGQAQAEVTLIHEINRRFTKSRLAVDGRELGYLYFAAK